MSGLKMLLALSCGACAAGWANRAAAQEAVDTTTQRTETHTTTTTAEAPVTTTTTATTTTEPSVTTQQGQVQSESGGSWAFSPFWVVGIDGEYIRTIPSDTDVGDPDGNGVQEALDGENGAAVHARLGYQLNLTILYLRPEIGGGAYFFGNSDDNTDRTEGRVYGGARLGLRTGLSPGVYGHLGYGWYGKDEGTENGFTADAGLLLDLSIIPHLNIGIHGGVVFNPDPVPFWLNGGAHVEFTF